MAAVLPHTHSSCSLDAFSKDIVWEAFANWEDGKTSTAARGSTVFHINKISPYNLCPLEHVPQARQHCPVVSDAETLSQTLVPCPKYPIGSHKCWNASLSSGFSLKTFSGFSLANVEIVSGTVVSCLVAFLLHCVCGLPGSVTTNLTRKTVKSTQWFRSYKC